MNAKSILQFLDDVTDAAKRFAPIASEFGIPLVKQVAGLADLAVDIAQNALERAEDAKVVFKSEDKELIEAKIVELRSKNDDLMRAVRQT